MGEPIWLYNRQSGQLETEQVYAQSSMDFLYGTRRGRLLERWLVSQRPVSWLYGRLRERPDPGQKAIRAFVEQYNIDLEELAQPLESFVSFQEFFVRHLRPGARPLPSDPHALMACADARLLALPLKRECLLPVKGRALNLDELLRNRSLAQQFSGGLALVFRLAPVDYHRFGYLDDGHHGPHVRLHGRLHSVSPLALRSGLPVWRENEREYTLLHTRHFGPVLHLDVGALLVGRIVQQQPSGGDFVRGQEKGYFEWGGSTVIQLLMPGRVQLDNDLLEMSTRGIETRVRYGMVIGRKT